MLRRARPLASSLVLAFLLPLAGACDDAFLFGRPDRSIDVGEGEGDAAEGEGDVGEGEGEAGEGEGEGDVSAEVCGGAVVVHAGAPIAMDSARTRHAAALLADGRVLLAGGHDDTYESVTSAALFDPATKTFTPTGSLAQARYDLALVALDDGRAVAFGGFNNDSATPDDNGDLASTEIWDPQNETWSAGPDMPEPRSGLSAVAVGGGTVVVFGGRDNAEAYPDEVLLFDASDDSLVAASGTISEPRGAHTALGLGDGRVVMAGGYFTSSLDDADMIFADGRAAPLAAIPGPRRSACASVDGDGRGLFFGGLNGPGTLDDVEAFDPTDNGWHHAGALATPRYACESVALSCLSLVCGGVDASSCEAWDYATQSAVPVLSDVGGAEYSFTLTRIDDAHALLAGGFAGEDISATARVISLDAP